MKTIQNLPSESGHIIENAAGTELTQREKIQFSGYLNTSDDSTNDATIISDAPTEIEYEDWLELTDQQKEGVHWLITDVPSTTPAGSTPESMGFGIGVCSTAAATAAKTATLADYVLTKNGIVSVRFSNDVPANATLNINGEGAVPIYFQNAAITADTILADYTVTFVYDGYVYHVISFDIGNGSGGTNVSYTPIVTSGTKIGEITIDDVPTDIYVPTQENADWNSASGASQILNKPTLGTASALDVASTGDASSSQVVKGNDTRLSDARPASDVSAWAKEATKPTYTKSEVGLSNVGNFKAVSTEASQGLSATEQQNARDNIGAGTSDFDGQYSSLTGTPTLGSAAAMNVATSGDAANNEVVKGDDTRLSDARPASDVPSWAKESTKPTYTATEVGAIASTEKGANNGVATLDSTGKIPSSQLPGSVDEIIEGYLYNGSFYEDSEHTILITGEVSKIYVDLSTNKTYRYSGSNYVEISASLALGETEATAYRGDRGKTAYDHSQIVSGNPHNVTKSDIGLSNVGNFKAVSTEDNQGLTNTEKVNARANIGAGTSNFDGQYSSLTGTPTLGTAAALNVAASGNASASEVVKGNDTRLSDARPASDVSAWAKADDKPTYTASEVGLGNVGNFKAVSTVANQGLNSTEQAAARANIGLENAPNFKPVSTEANQGLTDDEKANARNNMGLGSSAVRNAPTSGNASSSEVVLGNDSRLTDARNAADVYDWAKASTKPTYTKSEVGLSNVGNFKAVSTESNQGLSDTEKSNARANIGAGTSSLALGDTATTAAAGNHTHSISIATDSGTNQLSMASSTKYKITAGGSSYIFTTPGDSNNRRSFYATCSTAGDVAAKVVTVTDTGWELQEGTIIGVKFTNTNTVSNVTLNVNDSGASSIYYNNTVYTGSENNVCGFTNRITYYMYDGTNWVWLNTSALIDNKVAQTADDSTNSNFELLFSATADNTTRTETAKKSSGLTFNPSTGNLQTTQINGVTVGNSPQFTDTTYSKVSTNADGLAPQITDTTKYLKGDGTWSMPSASDVGAIASTAKGANNGVAELDSSGKVPSSQLPSFVDDVLEYDSLSEFPASGETGKIYVAKDTNKTYRWSGTAFVEISASLALGETESTAYRGDRGKTAYDHSQVVTGNPHNVTKSDVGLGNVGNFKAVSTEANQGLTDTEKENARTNIGAGNSNFDGQYSSLTGTPTLGTAAALDVATTGDASLSQVVKGDDSRLTNARNAADVYSWAKAETKPTYTASEVGLGNVGNFKAVSTVASQGLSDTEKENARTNIGAGTSDLIIGNTSTTAAAGNHTHEVSMATDAGTAEISLAANTTYELTAGGDTYLFKTPADTNTHRPIKVDGTEILGDDNTTPLDLVGGDNITVTNNAGVVTISAGGAGHDIQDKDDTTLTKRSNLKFGGYLNATDDSTNDASVVSDAPTEITWDEYNALTTAQKEGTKWLVTNVPGNIDPEAIFILRNQSLTFSNLTATVSDARINANTYPLVYWANASYDEAESCKIVSNTGSGIITFTAETAPTSSLVCDIVFISAATSSGGGGGSTGVKHILTLPTTGYTEETITIWGEEKTVQSITLTQDKDGYSLSGFVADMIADYPINISGTMTDFKKVYAVEIGNLNVTFHLTDVPSAAFNVLIKEA